MLCLWISGIHPKFCTLELGQTQTGTYQLLQPWQRKQGVLMRLFVLLMWHGGVRRLAEKLSWRSELGLIKINRAWYTGIGYFNTLSQIPEQWPQNSDNYLINFPISQAFWSLARRPAPCMFYRKMHEKKKKSTGIFRGLPLLGRWHKSHATSMELCYII